MILAKLQKFKTNGGQSITQWLEHTWVGNKRKPREI